MIALKLRRCGNITEMLMPRSVHRQMTKMDADIAHYVAGFISNSVQKPVTCVACCGKILL